jgi:hypothetical protein
MPAYSPANRATWQLLRKRNVNPVAMSPATMGNVGPVEKGRWLGAWMPFTGSVRDLPGAPVVDIDRYAFLPPEAASVVREGDMLRLLEQMSLWKVQKVQSYPRSCICALKTMTTFPVDGA